MKISTWIYMRCRCPILGYPPDSTQLIVGHRCFRLASGAPHRKNGAPCGAPYLNFYFSIIYNQNGALGAPFCKYPPREKSGVNRR